MALDTIKDKQVEAAIKNMLLGIAPERENEISELLKDLEIVFKILPDEHKDGPIIMDAGLFHCVRFNHRVVRSFWIGAFAAWEGYKAFYNAIAESDDISAADIDKFKNFVTSFEATIKNQKADDDPLPPGIPEPGFLPDNTNDPEGRAAAELAIIALGWAFLHEIRHIRHQREGTGAGAFGKPECNWKEEFSCDEFATKLILEKVQKYSDHSGDVVSLVRQKRELGIYFALFSLTLLSKDNWKGSDSHPAVQERINAVCEIMGHDEMSKAKAIAYASFAVLRTIWPSAPSVIATHFV